MDTTENSLKFLESTPKKEAITHVVEKAEEAPTQPDFGVDTGPVDATGTDTDADETKTASQRPTANELQDRQNRLMAELLTRYSKLVQLATAPEAGATLENQASLSLQMDVETTALVKAVEDLHRLTRDLKELWLAGPLRGISEGEGDGDMAADAAKVTQLVNGITAKVQELHTRKGATE